MEISCGVSEWQVGGRRPPGRGRELRDSRGVATSGAGGRGIPGESRVECWLSSDDTGRPAATVVPAVVLPGQVGGSHEHKALVGAAIL